VGLGAGVGVQAVRVSASRNTVAVPAMRIPPRYLVATIRSVERYSYETQPRLLAVLPFVGMVGVAILVPIIAIQRQEWEGLAFFAVWLAVGCIVGYQLLWKVSYRLELEGDTLRWFTPFRRGEVHVGEILSITPGFGRQDTVFEVAEKDDIRCLTRRGLPEFAALVAGDRMIPVEVLLPLGQRFGYSRFSRD
jgi:hypothetical protein